MMELQIGKTYWNGNGRKHFIAGVTKDHKWIVYSRDGTWFDQKTGQYVSGLAVTAHSDREPMWRDLFSEAS